MACSKAATPEVATYLIKVKEYKTNVPLPGVKISLYRCTNYDAVFGCQSKSVFATHSTDQKGEYAFIEAEYLKANEGIIFVKTGISLIRKETQVKFLCNRRHR